MYQYILFDLDGTLTEPKEGITKCVQYALAACGIDEPDLDNLTGFIGPPLTDEFMRVYGMSAEQAQFALEKYRERFSIKGLYENKAFDGAADLLDALKTAGKTIALATSKPQPYAEKILDNFNLKSYFDIIVGATFDGTLDKKSDVIRETLRQLGVTDAQKREAVMVGDRHHDLLGAKANGIDAIGIRLGYAAPGELEDCAPVYIADNLKELQAYLL